MRFYSCNALWPSLLFSLMFLLPATGLSDDLEAFAARLLCQAEDCPPYESPAPPPLIINGFTLPADAARERDDEQAFLVRQGSYLTDQGTIAALSDEPTSVLLPDRGAIQVRDHGPADLLPTTGPVIITTPRLTVSPQGSSRD